MRKPTIDNFIKKAKKSHDAKKCGMFLFHNGVVRETARAKVRENKKNTKKVEAIEFDYDKEKVEEAIKKTKQMPGIFYVDVWLNRGTVKVGDDLMYVIVGGDIRKRVIKALDILVDDIKKKCVEEIEKFSE